MTSGACPPSLPPSLFLLAQKRATKATTCSPCSDRASRAERGPHSTPSPQRNPLSQTRTHPFSLSSTGCSQQSVEDSGGLFLLSPFKKEKSLFLLGFHSWSCAAHRPPADKLSPLFFILAFSSQLWSHNDFSAAFIFSFVFGVLLVCFFIKLHSRGFLDPPLLLSCPTKLKHCCIYCHFPTWKYWV